jgi:aminoglycoside 6'-N-acetyltransferase
VQPTLTDAELELRPFVADDAPQLEAIFAEAEVKRWWPVPDYERDSGWTVLRDGVLSGWFEYHEESYEWYPSVAFDIALAVSLHGHGYGRRVMELGVTYFMARGHHRFTVDPNAANERAIRSYEAVGFRRVGVMRAYERSAEGGWNDGLLMELIRFGENI